jgi:hemolysin activation/secretion protein
MVLPGGLAWAQAVRPDAGGLLEQIRPPPEATLPKSPEIRHEEQAPPVENGGPRLRVERFDVVGATRFSEAELHDLVADAEGKDLSLPELQRLAGRITRHYRDHGYLLARAYLPAQAVEGGIVKIAVVEGRLGAVTVNNRSGLSGAALVPLDRLQTGDPAEVGVLERNLLLLSDLPGTTVQATLRPGETVGTTDLLVDVGPGVRIAGSLEADNFGDRFSGRNRLGAGLQFNNPLHLGDQASLRALTSEGGLAYGRLAYQLPVSAYGTRFGVAASWMHYSLGQELAPLDASGRAQTTSAYLLHPLIRSRGANLNAQLQFDHVALQDRIAVAGVTVDKTLDRWIGGISGDWRDTLGGGATNRFSLTYTSGRLKLDPETLALDTASAESAGRYGKWNLSGQRLQRLTDACSLYASVSGQLASKNLDSSEKLWLGGPNGVRAFPQGTVTGDEGYLLTLEARRQLPILWPGQWQLTVFYDQGHVRVSRNPWSSASNSRSISGAGFGLDVIQTSVWSIRSSVAWKTDDSAPAAKTDWGPQFWLQVVRYF